METIAYTLQWLVGVLATFSLTLSVWDKIRSHRAAKKKLHAAEAKSFEAALASDQLEILGEYLDTTIGAFDVSEYVANKEIAGRVDRYIARILSFVGTDEQIAKDENVQPPMAQRTLDISAAVEDHIEHPFDSFLAEVAEGEPWNALAKLRRYLEMELRNIALSLGFKERHLRSAGQIVRVLADKAGVDMDALQSVSYAISVSNRAIHGRDVSTAEAEEAVWNAAMGLRQLTDQLQNRSIIIIEPDP